MKLRIGDEVTIMDNQIYGGCIATVVCVFDSLGTTFVRTQLNPESSKNRWVFDNFLTVPIDQVSMKPQILDLLLKKYK